MFDLDLQEIQQNLYKDERCFHMVLIHSHILLHMYGWEKKHVHCMKMTSSAKIFVRFKRFRLQEWIWLNHARRWQVLAPFPHLVPFWGKNVICCLQVSNSKNEKALVFYLFVSLCVCFSKQQFRCARDDRDPNGSGHPRSQWFENLLSIFCFVFFPPKVVWY